MKKKYYFVFIMLLSLDAASQSTISSTNSGAYSGSDFMYSVGEIYVEPETNPDEANSGLMGILYQIAFNVSGLDEMMLTDDFRAYPNPTNKILYFNIVSKSEVKKIYVLDIHGRLLYSTIMSDNKVDLSNFPSGIYFIKTNVHSISSLKIIKQ
jgi:hypothetical protein